MQITKDSVTFQPVFGDKIARPNQPYGLTITLRQAEDECLCPVRLIKNTQPKPKTESDPSGKLSVPRKMGQAVTVSDGTIAS